MGQLRQVEGLTAEGGSVLGTRRTLPQVEEMYAINRVLEDHQVDALLVVVPRHRHAGHELASSEEPNSWYLGQVCSTVEQAPMQHMHEQLDPQFRRPKKQWWMALRAVHNAVSEGPHLR